MGNQRTNISRSQCELKEKTNKLLKRGKTRVTNLQVVVAIHLIGWDGCTSYRDQYMISVFFVIKGKEWEDDKYYNVCNNRRDNHDKKLSLILNQIYMVTDNEYLRGRDCKYRESLARLKKTKILIICLENPFREIYSKNYFKIWKIKCVRGNGEKRKLGFLFN